MEELGGWKRTHYSSEITPSMGGETVVIMGWARAVRAVGKLTFIQLADRDGFSQLIIKPKDVPEALAKELAAVSRETVLAVKGVVKANKEAPGGFEILPKEAKILSEAEAPLPMEVVTKKTPAEFMTRLDARFVDLRRPEIAAIFKIKDAVTTAVREYLEGNGFIEIHTPKIIAEASEGGSEVFRVKYYERDAYLAQSPQFYKQMMMATGFDRVYEIAPAFRAEKSHTTRHISEILMLDMEMAFINSVEDVMDTVEKMMISVCQYVAKNEEKQLKILGKEIVVPKAPFPRITVEEARKLLAKKGLNYKPDEEIDSAGEKALGEYAKEKYGHEFIFITEFPWAQAKFYHMQNPKNPKVAERCDLIYNGTEIATVTRREHRYQRLIEQAKKGGTTLEKIRFYLNAFRYGMPPHGGCGVGIERIVQLMLGLPTIQESVLFPRTAERITP